ncbi:hypothetical protein TESG_06763 [Trichophyton tonsurans CBS 112818]|uniref:Uncharacterized protein n=1 Tax=Trichophyton tonsurans (strain CBS 112818) TaxID=647933 RepID=F2S761_TRIT1|nr:hypothetical protein TESG_06763 [Trichophyton tonsurans CBS 112818]
MLPPTFIQLLLLQSCAAALATAPSIRSSARPDSCSDQLGCLKQDDSKLPQQFDPLWIWDEISKAKRADDDKGKGGGGKEGEQGEDQQRRPPSGPPKKDDDPDNNPDNKQGNDDGKGGSGGPETGSGNGGGGEKGEKDHPNKGENGGGNGGGKDNKPPKTDPPKNDPPKNDPPKNDPPKNDPPNNPPKNDPPKNDPPKSEPPPSVPTQQPDPPRDPAPSRPPPDPMTQQPDPAPSPTRDPATEKDPGTRTNEPQPTNGDPSPSQPPPPESKPSAEPTEAPTNTKDPEPNSTDPVPATSSSEPSGSSKSPEQTTSPTGDPAESSNGPPAPTSSSSSTPLTSSTTLPSPPKSKGSSLSKGGVAAGAVFGGFVVISLIFLTFVYYKRWKHTRENQTDEGSSRRLSPFPPTPPMGNVQQTQTGIVDHNESMAYDHNMSSFGVLSSPSQGDSYPHSMEEKGIAYSTYPSHQDAAYQASLSQSAQNELHLPQGNMGNTTQSNSLIASNEHQHQYMAYSPDLMEDEKTGFHAVGAPGLAPLPESSQENLHLHNSSEEYRRPIPKRYSAVNSHQAGRNSLMQLTSHNNAVYPANSQ